MSSETIRLCLVFVSCLISVTSSQQTDDECRIKVDISAGIKSGTSIIKDGVTYTQDDYVEEGNTIQGCICKKKPCLRKCCEDDKCLLSNTNATCVESTQSKTGCGDIASVIGDISSFVIVSVSQDEFCFKEGSYRVFIDSSAYSLEIKKSGTLIWEDSKYSYLDYCVTNVNKRLAVVICVFPDEPIDPVMISTGMIISMPFLLATFLVYALLPDRNLHQKALMFYVLSLFISYVLLVTINLTERIDDPACTLMGYFTLFFFMVSFFWMNVICVDIWFTFSGSRGFIGSKRSSERKRLLIYCLYAFGVPLLIAFIILLIQTYSDTSEPYNPNIGTTKCFISEDLPSLLYFYGEAAIIIIINVTLFALTAYKIQKVKKETSMLKQNDSKRHSYEKDKQKFNLFLKLLFAMGVNWSMEIISWAVNWSTGKNYQYIWYFTDFCNAAYGVFIFFIFVFKKKIWKLLQKRYYNFIGKPHLARTVTTSQSHSHDTRTSNYSSTVYSTAETNITDRTNVNGLPTEEVALHAMR